LDVKGLASAEAMGLTAVARNAAPRAAARGFLKWAIHNSCVYYSSSDWLLPIAITLSEPQILDVFTMTQY
jgi:hypothetical protein